MKKSLFPVWLLPVTVLCAVIALASVYRRIHVEEHNKATEISLEIETVQNLASAQGATVEDALSVLKTSGLKSLVLSETMVSDLQNSRVLDFNLHPKGAVFQILEPDPVRAAALRERVFVSLKRRFPGLITTENPDGTVQIAGDLPSLTTLRGASVGLDPDEVAVAKAAHLRIIARFSNPIGATAGFVTQTIQQAKKDGVSIFLPQGDQVLGRRNATKALEDALQANNIFYASPEFAKLGGDENIIGDIPEMVVRLHSAQAAELDKLPLAEAVDRYAKAARERNQRVLLIRPVSFAGETPLNDLGDFIQLIQKEIKRQGGDVGLARPFVDSKVPSVLFLALGLAMALPVWFGLSVLAPQKAKTALLVIVGLLAVGCLSHHGRPLMAFAGTLAFPMIAFLWLDENATKPIPLVYLVTTLISLVGGLCVAALLNGLPYFVRAEQFEGVKIAVFLPIITVAAYFFTRLGDLKEAMKNPITYGSAALGLVLIAILAFMISRTGNDNPAGVSGAELKMRDILDKVLFVRPRSKEFLIGHPLLIVGIGLLAWDRAKRQASGLKTSPVAGWITLALMMGAMGQTDVVNTLCHLHTPILLSLIRIVVGWIAGGILGAVLWIIVRSWIQRQESHA